MYIRLHINTGNIYVKNKQKQKNKNKKEQNPNPPK